MRRIDGSDVPGIVANTMTLAFEGTDLADVFQQAAEWYKRNPLIVAEADVIATSISPRPDNRGTVLIVVEERAP
jgi:hypothetical protein